MAATPPDAGTLHLTVAGGTFDAAAAKPVNPNGRAVILLGMQQRDTAQSRHARSSRRGAPSRMTPKNTDGSVRTFKLHDARGQAPSHTPKSGKTPERFHSKTEMP